MAVIHRINEWFTTFLATFDPEEYTFNFDGSLTLL